MSDFQINKYKFCSYSSTATNTHIRTYISIYVTLLFSFSPFPVPFLQSNREYYKIYSVLFPMYTVVTGAEEIRKDCSRVLGRNFVLYIFLI
jgi:hypothetical protein